MCWYYIHYFCFEKIVGVCCKRTEAACVTMFCSFSKNERKKKVGLHVCLVLVPHCTHNKMLYLLIFFGCSLLIWLGAYIKKIQGMQIKQKMDWLLLSVLWWIRVFRDIEMCLKHVLETKEKATRKAMFFHILFLLGEWCDFGICCLEIKSLCLWKYKMFGYFVHCFDFENITDVFYKNRT